MFLHIVIDSPFIDVANDIFSESFPGNNEFITFSGRGVHYKNVNVKTVSRFSFLSSTFLKSLEDYEAVFIHYMSSYAIQIVARSSVKVKFVWLGWGGDYHGINSWFSSNITILPETSKIVNQCNTGKNHSIKKWLKDKIFFYNIKDALPNVKIFCPVIEDDCEAFKSYFTSVGIKIMRWNYGNLHDHLIKNVIGKKIIGNNILVGNSASPENNHVDAFYKIKHYVESQDIKVICPLSYGQKDYADKVIKIGYDLFGNKFEPLLEFMQLEVYLKRISTCSIVVMNHVRQEGLGNIVAMLYLGARVFLRKDNSVFTFLRRNGAVVFSMDELSDLSGTQVPSLGINGKNKNIAVLEARWCKAVIRQNTIDVVEAVKSTQRSQNNYGI